MNSRQRVEAALNHQTPDRVPLDLGGSAVTGMHVSCVYKLRQALRLDPPGTPVKVNEPYQMLGEIAPDLLDVLGVDVVALGGRNTMFGYPCENWKPWTTFDGTPVLVPGAFNTEPEPNGDILMYPEGDRSAPPSGRMPKGGFYFDTIVRQEPIDDATLKVEDNLEEFTPISDDDLQYFASEADRLSRQSDRAILASFGGTAFGDIALVPAPWMKRPKGIRDIAEWYMSLITRREFIREVFARQADIAIANLERLWQAVGDRADIIYMSGTDFGTQNGPFCSPKDYCDLFQPHQRKLNDWVHRHTTWKTFQHCCGGVEPLIEHFIDAGYDILNPVQTSARGMDMRLLKEKYGSRITFWGGGIDTQHTLPFGTPDEVRREVLERVKVFAPGGGFVFNTIHNIQADVPASNVIALFDAVRESGL